LRTSTISSSFNPPKNLSSTTLAPWRDLSKRFQILVQRKHRMVRLKGRLKVGAHADLAVFDPSTAIDKATL
jgi:dihydroorotase-like cyclic amidohydrolase